MSMGVWFCLVEVNGHETPCRRSRIAGPTVLPVPDGSPTLMRLFMVFKLDAADLTSTMPWGDATMTARKMDSRTVQTSETLPAMTVAQIDQALRDFVLQDTAHLRRDAERASLGDSRREPESPPQMVSDLVKQMAGASLHKLDETIVDLRQLRDFLHAEGERIKREISAYLELNQVATGSTKLVVYNIAQFRAAAVPAAPRLGKARAEPERSEITASLSPAAPS
jgi:hypothetical protein